MRFSRLMRIHSAPVVLGFLLTTVGYASPAQAGELETKHYQIDYEGIGRQEVSQFGEKADRAYRLVQSFVENFPKHEFMRVKRIHMFIRPEFRIPRTLIFLWKGRNRMEMPVHRVQDGRANLLHETAHSLAPSRNRFLAEGLAVYLEERLGTLNAFPTFGRPVRVLFCKFRSEGHFVPIRQLLGETIDNPVIFTRRYGRTVIQRMAYLEGGALARRLLEDRRFGLDEKTRKTQFFRVFNGDGTFEKIYNMSAEAFERYLISQTCRT